MESINKILDSDTIAAVATPPGNGGISVIRISGPESIKIVNSAWKGKDLTKVSSHTVSYGSYISKSAEVLDECLASVFISPASFTGEDTVELSVHGSQWIQREILNDLIKRGARMAQPGEFTKRAFINGKLDLAQAEGVADLIASSSKAAHDMAINQIKGSFSKEFDLLRKKLIEFASLMELELDFSEEEVEFAERESLLRLCNEIINKVSELASSYSRGAVLKEGVPVVIAGIPNAGKSSLLNLLLNEEKAIVTDIPGTTRDIIEGAIELDGILYRFYDTAGLRATDDVVESIGVDRAIASMKKAFIVIWLIDGLSPIEPQYKEIENFREKYPEKHLLILHNKSDLKDDFEETEGILCFSNHTRRGYNELLTKLHALTTQGKDLEKDIIVTNARHYEALIRAEDALGRVKEGLESGLSGDFIAQDIREATAHLATITGAITTDNLLSSIFSRFCIGK